MNNQFGLPLIVRRRNLLYLGLVFFPILFLHNPIVGTAWRFWYDPTIGQEEKHTKDTDCLRIATYNIRRKGKERYPEYQWEHRLPAVVKLIEDTQPDIIGLQEPTKDQINDLASQLKNYGWFGQGRGESWSGRGTNEYNPIFYNEKYLILHKKGTFHLNNWKLSWLSWLKQPHTIGLLPRICTWGFFEIKKTGHRFYLYNTHLDHKFTTARSNQLRTIIDIIKQNNDVDNYENNTILLGDFNTDLDGTIRSIINKEALRDTRDLAEHTEGPQKTTIGWYTKDLQRIDHILIKNKNKSRTPTVKQHVVYENKKIWTAMVSPHPVICRYPSDHHLVFTDVCFPQNNY